LARLVVAALFLLAAGLIDWVGLAGLALFWGPLLMILGTGLGLLLAPFGLLYKDVGRTIALISPLWMLLTPVIYPLPSGAAGTLMAWVNPPAATIHIARSGVVRPPTAAAEPQEVSAPPGPSHLGGETLVGTAADLEHPSPLPVAPVWLPACLWLGLGVLLFLVGAVWLDLSGPIIIERLAN
jgi:hypothetical protein